MNSGPHIVCDVDGVLAQMVESLVLVHCGGDAEKRDAVLRDWPPGEYDLGKVLDKRTFDVWYSIDARMNFWLNIDPTDWALEMLAELRAIAGRLTVATVPRIHGMVHKWKWMTGLAPMADDWHLCEPDKSALAAPGAILIDDSDAEARAWIGAGGLAIVFPQPWNSRHAQAGPDAWRVVMEEVRAADEEQARRPTAG